MKGIENKLKVLATLVGLSLGINSYSQDTIIDYSLGKIPTKLGFRIYNEKDQLIKRVLKKREVTHVDLFEYDKKGQKIKREHFRGGGLKGKNEIETFFYEYHNNGELAKETIIYQGENKITYEYNEKGEKIKETIY